MSRTPAEQQLDQMLIDSCIRSELGEVKKCLEAGANLNFIDYYGGTSLHRAENVEITNFLLRAGANPNVKNRNSKTPLHYIRNIEMAKVLIAAGADLEAKSLSGNTPLHWNINCGKSLEVIRTLLIAGANLNAKNNDEQTPLGVAIENNESKVISELKAAEYVDRVIDWYKDPSKLPGVVPPEFTSEHYDLLKGRMKSIFQRDGVPPKFFKMTGKNPDSAINKEVDGTPIIPPDIKDVLQKFAKEEEKLNINSPKYLANIFATTIPSLIQKEPMPDMPLDLYKDREAGVTQEQYLKETATLVKGLFEVLAFKTEREEKEDIKKEIAWLQGNSLMILYDEKEWKSKEAQVEAFNEFAGLKAAAGAGVSREELIPDLTLNGLFNAIATGKNLPIIPHSEGALLGSFPELLAEPQKYLSEHSLMAIHENIQNAKDGYYDKDTFANIQNLSRNISKIAKPMISDYERDHSPTAASEVAHASEAHSGAKASAAAHGGAGRAAGHEEDDIWVGGEVSHHESTVGARATPAHALLSEPAALAAKAARQRLTAHSSTAPAGDEHTPSSTPTTHKESSSSHIKTDSIFRK